MTGDIGRTFGNKNIIRDGLLGYGIRLRDCEETVYMYEWENVKIYEQCIFMISLGIVPLYSFLDLSNYCLFPQVPTPFPVVSQASARTRPFDPYLKPIQDISRQLIFNLCRYIESEGDRECKCYNSQKRCTLPWYSSCFGP